MPPKPTQAGLESSRSLKKRKEPPQSLASSAFTNKPNPSSKGRSNTHKRVKVHDARSILAQTSDAALSNGELDLQKFLAAREFEIKALDDGIRRSKGALTTRAFQQVPRDMRRRTASHNVKKVPKRLRDRAKREMREDNTPTVTAKTRKPGTSRGRLRAETARRLGLLTEKKERQNKAERTVKSKTEQFRVVGRMPRVKRGILAIPDRPMAKFRKRQIHKTWLPTHMWHTKRAKMTEPKKPLWRFAVPLTSTEKSYRPTHRSGGAGGAVCWDMSYMATIGLEGTDLALEKVLRGVGIVQDEMWAERGRKWRDGKRSWNGVLSRAVEGEHVQIGPTTVIWSAFVQFATNKVNRETSGGSEKAAVTTSDGSTFQERKHKKTSWRHLIIRIHPSAFLELWEEILRLSKMQRPVVHVEDLRFEIGTIEITGPGSTESLLGILNPIPESGTHAKIFKALSGVTNAASLPANSLLTFSVEDPRLRYPPRRAHLPKTDDEQATHSLLELLSAWPADNGPISDSFFDREARRAATRLPSQKTLNRRNAIAGPGEFPSRIETDPLIPLLLYVTRTTSSTAAQGTWTLLAPWKCVLPIWYGLMHFPLSSGGNPRFGGIQELQQIYFEHGKPWFPADYPGTRSGWSWELDERQTREEEWKRRPKGKRPEFSSLNLGLGKKGEIGLGWACDFEKLIDGEQEPSAIEAMVTEKSLPLTGQTTPPKDEPEVLVPSPPFKHLPSVDFARLLENPKIEIAPRYLAVVRVTLFSRGVPLSCGRIYRLPSSPASEPLPMVQTQIVPRITPNRPVREQWLALETSHNTNSNTKPITKYKKPSHPINNTPLGRRALAQTLLQSPPLAYPAVPINLHPALPGEEDLIGFVTTGNFNLAEGKGTAIGSIVVAKVVESLLGARGKRERREAHICIIRNAGETIGRLAIWDAV